jgi:hypothetical protein
VGRVKFHEGDAVRVNKNYAGHLEYPVPGVVLDWDGTYYGVAFPNDDGLFSPEELDFA